MSNSNIENLIRKLNGKENKIKVHLNLNSHRVVQRF